MSSLHRLTFALANHVLLGCFFEMASHTLQQLDACKKRTLSLVNAFDVSCLCPSCINVNGLLVIGMADMSLEVCKSEVLCIHPLCIHFVIRVFKLYVCKLCGMYSLNEELH